MRLFMTGHIGRLAITWGWTSKLQAISVQECSNPYSVDQQLGES